MTDNGNRITVCCESEAWSGALRLLLDGYDVHLATDPSTAADGSDVLVWSPSNDPDFATVEPIARRTPTLLVAEPHLLIEAVDAGCRGFLTRSTPLEEVRNGVEVIAHGGAVLPPDLLGTLLKHLVARRRSSDEAIDELSVLTPREREVFALAARGSRKDQIAKDLFISSATARTHLQRVYRKLSIHSQAELISLAVRLGVVGTEEETE